MENWSLDEAIAYYKGQDAPSNQEALVNLLREVQENNGGVLPDVAMEDIAAALNIKPSFLGAVIKRYPSLRTESAPHRLEVCGGPNCARNGSAKILKHLASEYKVQSGGISKKGGFSFKICGCMKHCPHGPNIKWDGVIYNKADEALLDKLIKGEN